VIRTKVNAYRKNVFGIKEGKSLKKPREEKRNGAYPPEQNDTGSEG